MIRVLYIHHSGVFGGASRSLLELIKAFPENTVKSTVLLPNGSAAAAFSKQGIETVFVKGLSQFDNTSYSHYKGLRWLILIREILLLPFTYSILKKVKKELEGEIDLIHINEITNLPSVILAGRLLDKPIVLHVRSLQRKPDGFRNKWIYKFITKYVARIIAIDETVAGSLPKELPIKVIHNGFDPLSTINSTTDNVENEFSMFKGKLKVVIVGNILYMKGIEEFVKAAKICKENGLNVDFVIVGDKAKENGIVASIQKLLGLSHDAKEFVLEYIATNNLEEMVHLIKFTPDITTIYKNCDILCFPSHLNAVGRPVFEAAFLKKPSIVAINDPEPDTVIPMQTGLCIAQKDPSALYEAIKYFYNDPKEITRMGDLAYNLAIENFDIKKNAVEVLNEYKILINTMKGKQNV